MQKYLNQHAYYFNMVNEALSGKSFSVAYKIGPCIGQGAFSTVYRLETSGRPLALKVYKPENLKLAEAEVNILAKLSHPNILGIYDFDPNGIDNNPCIILELAPQTLENIIKSIKASQLSDKDKRHAYAKALAVYGPQLLNALEYIREKNIVHKDIKPKNLLIAHNDTLKLSDFNLSRDIDVKSRQEMVEQSAHTESGKFSMLGGTEGWAAPEQMQGSDPGKINHTTDIYSAGGIIYALATGQMPPGREKPSCYGAPKWLDSLVETAMAREKANRFQSAERMKSYLQRGIEGKLDLPKKPSERSRILRRAFHAGMIISVIGGAAYLAQPAWEKGLINEKERQMIAEREKEKARQMDADRERMPVIKDAHDDKLLMEELRNEQGLIAYAAGDTVVRIINSKDILNAGRSEKRITLPGSEIKKLLWSNDGNAIYALTKFGSAYQAEKLCKIDVIKEIFELLRDFDRYRLDDSNFIQEINMAQDGRLFIQSRRGSWYTLNEASKTLDRATLIIIRNTEGGILKEEVQFVNQSKCSDGEHFFCVSQLPNSGNQTEICNQKGGDIIFSNGNVVAAWHHPQNQNTEKK